jgi:hypothetical protein
MAASRRHRPAMQIGHICRNRTGHEHHVLRMHCEGARNLDHRHAAVQGLDGQMKMRYPGQNWSLTFDIKTNKGAEDLSFVDDTLGTRAIDAFNERHMEEYGHVREGEIPEVVGVRLSSMWKHRRRGPPGDSPLQKSQLRSPRGAAPTWARATRRRTCIAART